MLTLSAIVPATDRPGTLARCVEAIRAAKSPPEEIIQIDSPAMAGPASARNQGAQRAGGDILVFVDADVEVHPDAFVRIRKHFETDPELTAVFGSYDDDPAASDAVSDFRNLLHHYIHQTSPGPATTFWAGLGAIRRADFAASGGFDEKRYPRPSIEDVELGFRLSAAAKFIVLDPEIQGKHLKAWTLGTMVHTDLVDRGVAWTLLLLESRRIPSSLNLGWTHRLSAAACLLGIGALVLRRPYSAAAAGVAFVALNASFYRLLLDRRGPARALLGIPLHVLHHLTGTAAVPIAAGYYLTSPRRES